LQLPHHLIHLGADRILRPENTEETIIQARQGERGDITYEGVDGSWLGAPWLGSHEQEVVLPNVARVG
jgi:hypothetical protein